MQNQHGPSPAGERGLLTSMQPSPHLVYAQYTQLDYQRRLDAEARCIEAKARTAALA